MSTDFDQQAFRQFERDGYSGVAEGYAKKIALVSAQTNDAILNAVNAKTGVELLDIACGPGLLSAGAIERGATVSSLDFAPNMVAAARSRCPDADVQEGDAEDLPFDVGRFDAVVCSLGILHFPNLEVAVDEVFRVLKPGGHYAFSCWTPPDSNPLMGLVVGSIAAHGTMEIDLPAGPPLFRFGDPAECENILGNAGFEDISVTECPLHWPSASGQTFLNELHTSGARLGPMIAKQSDENRPAVERAIIQGAEKYQAPEGIRIPSMVNIATGRKP